MTGGEASESNKMTSDSQTLLILNVKRSSMKGQITKFKNYILYTSAKETLTPIELAELTLKLGRFESLSTRFDDLQSQIEVLNPMNLSNEVDERDDIEQLFIHNIALAQSLVQKHTAIARQEETLNTSHSSSSHTVQCHHDSSEAGFKLPQIQISKFDGSFFRWLEFRDTYLSLIHNNDRISSIHKFHYLLSYLTGDAARIVSNLSVSSDNYKTAWRLLLDRYDNKRQLINHHLDSLLNIQQRTFDSKSLRFLIDHVNKNLRALNSLGQPTDKWDTLIIHMISSRLDNSTRFKWEERRGAFNDYPDLQEFCNFIMERANIYDTVQRNSNSNYIKPTPPTPRAPYHNYKSNVKSFACTYDEGADNTAFAPSTSTAMATQTALPSHRPCPLCHEGHRIYDCPTFMAKSVDERIDEVQRLKLCINCLRYGHAAQACVMGPCRVCKGKHNSLVHKPINKMNSNVAISNVAETDPDSCSISNFSIQNSTQVLLSTAYIEVANPCTQQVEGVRALLDCGSQSSFITQSLKDKLSLTTKSNCLINVIGIGDNCTERATETVVARLNSLVSKFSVMSGFLILPKISGNLPRLPVEKHKLNIPNHFKLADPNFHQPAPIDVLIGADLFWDILGREQHILGPKLPKLLNSEFGWLVSGPIYSNFQSRRTNVQSYNSVTSNMSSDDDVLKYNSVTSNISSDDDVLKYNSVTSNISSDDDLLKYNSVTSNMSSDDDVLKYNSITSNISSDDDVLKYNSVTSNISSDDDLLKYNSVTSNISSDDDVLKYNSITSNISSDDDVLKYNSVNSNITGDDDVLKHHSITSNISGDDDISNSSVTIKFLSDDDIQIHQELTKFWELEEVPRISKLSESERACEAHFMEHVFRLDSGRFSVNLPLKDSPDCLGQSYFSAKKRLLNLEKRFKRNPEVKSQYIEFMREYSKMGHLSESPISIPYPSYFLSHHCVFKESESTQIRVVFDGSSPTSSGYSVNDLLLVGPSMQDSLFSILIRARLYKYLLTGDIEKMYRQVLISQEDRDLQLILWREDESMPIKTLQLNTVTYGMASSSYLSTRCLWQLGEECSDPQIKDIIQHDFYVDDLLTGASDESSLRYIHQAVSSALLKGCFNLRKFKSNLPSILDSVSSKSNDSLIISESTSTLGMGWNPSTDQLHFPFKIPPVCNENITKRIILSSVFKIFDPLGLLSPCVIKAKFILQQLWLRKLTWDDPIPYDIQHDWINFAKVMPTLLNITIPRQVLCNNPIKLELHSFSDASQRAYGTCIYLRSLNPDGQITVRLLCSKSRVAPIKTTTIPRLELCAALLAAKLCRAVKESLRFTIDTQIHWCDSSIVLGWLHTSFQNLKTFVSNRVSEICELTNSTAWRYVPTSVNPADLISRGVSPDQLENIQLWWSGPRYLSEPESTWPVLTNTKIDLSTLPETKITVANLTVNLNPIINFCNYSSLNKLKRSFAYVLRFINNTQNKTSRRTGILSVDELNLSFINLCRLSQRESFSLEYNLLSSGKFLSPKSTILSLTPFFSDDRVIRVGGRLEASDFNFDKKHPILLHASHHFTKIIFQYEHIHNLHAGPQLLLATIREYVWPINGRNLARRTFRNCFKCRRLQGKTLQPMMGNLPAQRITPSFPFKTVGLDFAGPFNIVSKRGRGATLIKCYLCIFVCLRYKCVHLEAVSDMSKNAFVMTFRRFVSRRGKPTEVFCDNGRNFVAGAKEINHFLKANSGPLSDFASEEGIKFLFSPNYAPHFGAIFEANIRIAKFHLKRVMGNSHLTFEEITTLFAQVEAILNSRPLCPLSSSPDDFLCLTPGNFLIGRALTAVPSPTLENCNANNLQRYERLLQIQQHFWRRWQREYISELQQRRKWKTQGTCPRIGDLVLIQDDNAPPLCWKLGRITRLFYGPKDAIPRVADVMTPRRSVQRLPLVRLCLLPTAEELHC